MNYLLNTLPEDPIEAEQMLFDMLARSVSLKSWTREKSATITKDPGALGHSPEVTSMISEAEKLGIVWVVCPDGFLFVIY